MRIGFFVDAYIPEINGVVTATKTLFDAFTAQGHECFVVTTNPFDKTIRLEDHILRIPGIRLKHLYDYRLAPIYNWKAAKYIKEMRLDIIHVHTELSIGVFGRILAKRFHIPMVYTYHTMYIDYTHYVTKGHFDPVAKAIVKRFSKLVATYCSEFTTTSNKTKLALRSYGVERYINVIPNGIDLDKFHPDKIAPSQLQQFRKTHGLENKMILLSLGRVAKEKSIDVLLEGYAKFLQNHSQIETKFLIVGDGPARPELEAMVADLHLESSVTFLGKVSHDEVPFYYALADLYLSASVSETQGLTFIEAMATKTMVLARFDQNLVEVIQDGETGFFFQSEEDYVERLTEIMLLPEETKQQIKQAAFLSMQERYSMITFYERMKEVYDRAIRKQW